MRLIDADALKDYLKSLRHESKRFDDRGFTFVMCMLTENVCKDIDRQPTIEERKWIPVSERLPDGRLNKSYLVQDKDGRLAVGTYTNWGWMFARYMNDPVAWMPLPEPYREEGD